MKKLAFTLYLLLAGCATAAHAEERIFSGGSAVKRGYAPVADFSVRLPSERGYWQGSLTLTGEAEGQRNNAALQALYVMRFKYVDVGLGAALLQNVDAFNGSHANFALQVGRDFGAWTVQWRHWSNAGTKLPNLGRDMLFLGRRL